MKNIKDISGDLFKYPKTVIFEMTDFQFDTRKVYHVENSYQLRYLESIFSGYDVTIQDYSPELEETRPNWRHQIAKSFIRMFPEHLMLREDAPAPVEEENDDY